MANQRVDIYEKYVKPLPRAERLRLLDMAVHDLPFVARQEPKNRSILELRGLGKEIWQGIDAQEYVEGLREEWERKP